MASTPPAPPSRGDPRLTLEAKPEVRFYAEQSEALAAFIRILGTALAVIFAIGATVGAMITMFGSVAARIGEFGMLRALGFRCSAVLGAFLGDALLLSLLGGTVGLLAAGGTQAVASRRRTSRPLPNSRSSSH